MRPPSSSQWNVLSVLLEYAALSVAVLLKMKVMERSSEMARLIGVDFQSILTRGSQFRVESVMLRITKPLNYVLIAPSRQQVAEQAAMEVLLPTFFFRIGLGCEHVFISDWCL